MVGLLEARRRLLFRKSKNLIGRITSITIGWIASNGTVDTNTKRGGMLQSIPVEPNTTYTMSWNGIIPYSMSACEYNGSTFIIRSHTSVSASGNPKSLTFRTANNCNNVVLQYYLYQRDVVEMSFENMLAIKPMLELGASHTSYEP